MAQCQKIALVYQSLDAVTLAWIGALASVSEEGSDDHVKLWDIHNER